MAQIDTSRAYVETRKIIDRAGELLDHLRDANEITAPMARDDAMAIFELAASLVITTAKVCADAAPRTIGRAP